MKSLNVDESVNCKCSAVDGDPARGHAFPLTSTSLSLRTWGGGEKLVRLDCHSNRAALR